MTRSTLLAGETAQGNNRVLLSDDIRPDATAFASRLPGSCSVVIATYSQERWCDLVEAVRSVQSQPRRPEVIVAVDHNLDLSRRVTAELPGVVVVANDGPHGASGTRNAGVAASRAEVIAFLDDDAIASGQWLDRLLERFGDPRVLGVGGRNVALWSGPVPRWFSPELGWVIGATDRCMPDEPAVVRNVWSSNMAVRRRAFDRVGGFRAGFGRTDKRPWPEDTDFCLRVSQAHPGGVWVFQPSAEILHKVKPARRKVSYFLARSWYEGLTKPQMASFLAAQSPAAIPRTLSSEWAYVARVLPTAVVRDLFAAVARRDLSGLARAGVIVASTTASALGMVTAQLDRVIHRLPSQGVGRGT